MKSLNLRAAAILLLSGTALGGSPAFAQDAAQPAPASAGSPGGTAMASDAAWSDPDIEWLDESAESDDADLFAVVD